LPGTAEKAKAIMEVKVIEDPAYHITDSRLG
jgi:hypothetical protein